MSITTVGHRSAGDERAASAPGLLLRGPMHRYEPEVVQFETIRGSSVGAGALLRGVGVTGVVLAAAFGAYLLVADAKRSADAEHDGLSAARVQHEAESAAPAPVEVESDTAQTPTEAGKQEPVAASPREAGLDTPRLVRTERFEGDPSVWANVRKFVPLPPDQVPVLDIAPAAQPPIAAPAAPDSAKDIGAPHRKPARAKRHRRPRVRTHARVRDSQTQADGGAPVDVGGTRMTALELQQDGSTNPLVSAFSGIFGPN